MHIAYAAGLFDGEGSILITKHYCNRPTKPYRRFQLKVSIGMTHYPTVEALYQRFGGSIIRNDSAHNNRPANRIQYHWYSWSDHAYRFLVEVEPFLITKREEVLLGIEFQRHVKEVDPLFRKHKGRPPNYDAIYEYRDDLIARLRALKKVSFDISREDLKISLSVNDGPNAACSQAAASKVELLAQSRGRTIS
jgi:hypothetical protein